MELNNVIKIGFIVLTKIQTINIIILYLNQSLHSLANDDI